MQRPDNRRVLIVDDNAAIHGDFKKLLLAATSDESALRAAESALFDDAPRPAATAPAQSFEVDSAFQGEEALERVRNAHGDHLPYALAFVDMRMPPGWDGVETIQRLWQADPDVQVVVCTAYADYSWPEMVAKLGRTDRLLILKKPFDAVEVLQLATALTEKWNVLMRERQHVQAVLRAEQEARAYAASLEMVNRALEASWAKSEAESRQKSEFLSHVASDVLGPIDHLLERANTLLAPAAHSSVGELEQLGRSAVELASSLRAVVDWSRIDVGRSQGPRTPFEPDALVREACERVRAQAAARGLAIESSCAANAAGAAVTGESTHLARALEELLANAVRRAQRGPVRVAGALRSQPGASAELVLTVSDDGRNLTREELANVFEPFGTQAGANLGLPLAKRIADALGGELSCQSDSDAGTCFTLSAPVELGASCAAR